MNNIDEMDAITYDVRSKKLDLIKVNIPDVIDKDSVLIKVAYAGICGTDLHIIQVRLTIFISQVLSMINYHHLRFVNGNIIYV